MRYPTPRLLLMNSPMIAPMRAAGIVMRSAVTMKGSALGSTTFRNTASGAAPITRTTDTSCGGTVATPASVLRKTTKKTKVAARRTFGSIPMPNQMIMSGASAIFGVA